MNRSNMLTRKKVSENSDLGRREIGPKKEVAQGPVKYEHAKPKPAVGQTRRAVFGDITNASNESAIQDKKKVTSFVKPTVRANVNLAESKLNKPVLKKKTEVRKKTDNKISLSQKNVASSSSGSTVQKTLTTSSNKDPVLKNPLADVPIDRVEEDFSFVIVDDTDVNNGSDKPKSIEDAERSLLAVDLENYTDVFNVGIYAQHIFDYYKRREKMFPIPDYLNGDCCHVTRPMRAILVDWLVEVQENFELNHETLYLAVKLTDLYMSRATISKEMLQLVGAVTIFIASKFDERCPPMIEDFTYVCDNAFDRDQFIAMEMEVLRTVDFDLGIPISYTFLRRYAKVARMSMETLTLARFVLEMSLMEYELVGARDSMLAAAALYIAQKMKHEGKWEGDVVMTSGYEVQDLKVYIVALNNMLHQSPIPQLNTIRSKYSHEIFHKVAKIPLVPTAELLQL